MSLTDSMVMDELTSHTLTVERLLGRADDGTPSYGGSTTYTCHMEFKTKNTLGRLSMGGQVAGFRGRAWVNTLDPISVDDRVTLDDGTQPIILQVTIPTDQLGPPIYTLLEFQ